MQITLNLRKSVQENANEYFEKAKKSRRKIEGAQKTITAAVIGFMIVIAAYFATQIVNYIFKLGVVF